jgi:uncharacterized membrane protein YdbT with pleckstrin-like domain
MEDKDVLVIRPVFNRNVWLISMTPIYLFLVFWGIGFFGIFGMLLFLFFGIPKFVGFLFAFTVFGLILPVFFYNTRKKTYEKTSYRFSADRLDCVEGFWAVNEKTIELKNIIEVSLRKGIIQKKANLGTVFLSTPARGTQMSGITLFNIANPDQTYAEIKRRIDRAKKVQAV